MADSLVVIRSGATDYDLQGRIRGTLEMPLCAEGIAEAQAAAAACSAGEPLAALYSSPASCAAETSRIIGRAIDVRPRRVEGLANFDQGLWQGMLVDDIRRKQPRLYRQWQDNPWAVAPPEGELLDEVCGRVESVLEKLFKRHAEGTIALVVPAPLDRIVRWLAGGEPISDLWLRDPEAALSRISLATQWTSRPVREKARV
jgi:broad specificity phosphatase PhoE